MLKGYQGTMSLKDPRSRPDEVSALHITEPELQLLVEGIGRNKERRTQNGEGWLLWVWVLVASRISKVLCSQETKEIENEKYEEGEKRRKNQ